MGLRPPRVEKRARSERPTPVRLGPNSSKPNQSQSKPDQENGLGFSWICSSDSGLFNGLRAVQSVQPRARRACPSGARPSGERRREFFGTTVAARPSTRYWGSGAAEAIPFPGADLAFSSRCGAISRRASFPSGPAAPQCRRPKRRGSRDRPLASPHRSSPRARCAAPQPVGRKRRCAERFPRNRTFGLLLEGREGTNKEHTPLLSRCSWSF